jgi:hypothetical protein
VPETVKTLEKNNETNVTCVLEFQEIQNKSLKNQQKKRKAQAKIKIINILPPRIRAGIGPKPLIA